MSQSVFQIFQQILKLTVLADWTPKIGEDKICGWECTRQVNIHFFQNFQKYCHTLEKACQSLTVFFSGVSSTAADISTMFWGMGCTRDHFLRRLQCLYQIRSLDEFKH